MIASSERMGTTIIDSSTSSVPAMVAPRGSAMASSMRSDSPWRGDPAGEALADLRAQQLEGDLLVGADLALEGDGHQVVGRLEEVDPAVVVVDDAARLLDDGGADLRHGGQPVHARDRGLHGRQLGRPALDLARPLPDRVSLGRVGRGVRAR